ncbi:MAG: VWA domain-containing protein [Bacteroidota bacterium]
MFNLDQILAGQQLELGVPWVLWLLPLPLLILLLPPMKYQAEALFVPFFQEVLAIKKEKPSKGIRMAGRNWFRVILMWLVWICFVTALASPQLVGEPEKQIKTARNLLLNVDLSLSMETRDWISAGGERSTRWDAVKEVMDEFIEMREGDRMGLVLFASQAYLQVPFTSDLQVVHSLLEESEIGLAGAKTVIGNAIGKAIELFESDSVQERVMVLVTDGADSGSELPPLQAARMAALDSITIYTIGIGSLSSGAYELDETTLKAIAEATGGQYFRASDRKGLREIYTILDELEPIEYEDEDYIPRRLMFYYPLMAAFGVVVLFHVLAGLFSTLRFLLHRIKPEE